MVRRRCLTPHGPLPVVTPIRRLASMAASGPPRRRHIKCTRPYPKPANARPLLLLDVVGRIAPIGDCPTVRDHQIPQIIGIGPADGNQAAVAVTAAADTRDHAVTRPASERCARTLPARPLLARRCLALLPDFRRVDAMQSDPRPVHIQGVTIDGARHADHQDRRCRSGKRVCDRSADQQPNDRGHRPAVSPHSLRAIQITRPMTRTSSARRS